jgi:hypothetical protein
MWRQLPAARMVTVAPGVWAIASIGVVGNDEPW